jgi:hypothetical protein
VRVRITTNGLLSTSCQLPRAASMIVNSTTHAVVRMHLPSSHRHVSSCEHANTHTQLSQVADQLLRTRYLTRSRLLPPHNSTHSKCTCQIFVRRFPVPTRVWSSTKETSPVNMLIGPGCPVAVAVFVFWCLCSRLSPPPLPPSPPMAR